MQVESAARGPNGGMTRRERLMATLSGRDVDRPAINFYELNGLDQDPNDPDPYNVFNHPSWGHLIELTRERTDRIVMRGAVFRDVLPDPLDELTKVETWGVLLLLAGLISIVLWVFPVLGVIAIVAGVLQAVRLRRSRRLAAAV